MRYTRTVGSWVATARFTLELLLLNRVESRLLHGQAGLTPKDPRALRAPMNFELAVLVVYSSALIGSTHRETLMPSRGAYHHPVSYARMKPVIDDCKLTI